MTTYCHLKTLSLSIAPRLLYVDREFSEVLGLNPQIITSTSTSLYHHDVSRANTTDTVFIQQQLYILFRLGGLLESAVIQFGDKFYRPLTSLRK